MAPEGKPVLGCARAERTSAGVLGATASSLGERAHALIRVNALVRGFRNYFALGEEPIVGAQMRELDSAVERLALELLPPPIMSDPARMCRERFALAPPPEVSDSTPDGVRQIPVHEVYPDEQPVRSPGWMAKRDGPEPKSSGVAVLPQATPAEDDDPAGNEPGVVEHGGRLYVLAHGSYLTAGGEVLVVKKRKREIYRQPLGALGVLFLQGVGMNVSISLALACVDRDIPMIVAP
ncbi:MAG: hypothetical protein HYU51_09020, partial [Candidatus Rokubacteria bacterium]|nr:hypothetical protein [Candidatus Rokubacteria bacterium]